MRPTLQPALLFLLINWVSVQSFVVRGKMPSSCRRTTVAISSASSSLPSSNPIIISIRRLLSFAPILLLGPFLDVPTAHAISGGGKDYAEAKITDQDFSGKDLSKKDFSGAFAQRANFKGAKLMGARFYKSALTEADFTGADLTSASFEGANMVDAILKDAIVNNAYFTETVLKVGSIEGADFSDTLLDRFVQKKLCEKATGTNPKTKVDTRESLLCD